MCEFLIFNTQKRYEKQKNFGNFSATFLKKIATFWQLLDTFIGNFFGIHRQLVAKPTRVYTSVSSFTIDPQNKARFYESVSVKMLLMSSFRLRNLPNNT